MSETPTSTDLFERYAYQVVKRLPRKKQKDIMLEIISSLEDELEDRVAAEGREADEDMIVTVIKKFGPPSVVSSSYQPQNFLIGPKLYPLFLVAIKIGAIVLGALLLSGVVVQILNPAASFSQGLWNYWKVIENLISVPFTILGFIAAIFFVIERSIPNLEDKSINDLAGKMQPLLEVFGGIEYQEGDYWDPREYPTIEKPNRIHRREVIFGSVFLIIFLIWFNFFPQNVGIVMGNEKGLFLVPILSAGFSSYIIWLSIGWAISLALDLWTLVLGQKTKIIRWAEILLRGFSIFVLYKMIQGPELFGLNPAYLASHSIPQESLDLFHNQLIPLANSGTDIAFLVAISASTLVAIFSIIKEFQEFKVTE